MKVVLYGASGMIGSRILQELSSRGHTLTAVVRHSPPPDDTAKLVDATRSLIAGLQKAGVKRFLMAGGAGSLRLPWGRQLVDAPDFPPAFKAIALAHRDALDVIRQSDLDWTSFSPAASIEPGARTGKFRLGKDDLIADQKGESRISAEDYAIPWPTSSRVPNTSGSASPSGIETRQNNLLTFPRGGSNNL
jgi:putative NADH-flavin reductase